MLKRILHFLWTVLVLLGFVAIAAALAVQIILWTDLPGRWVLSSLSDRTGMDVSVERFRTSWGGTTRLTGLTIRLPLEEDPFVDADRVILEHNGLLSLALTRRFRLDDIQLEPAAVRVTEDRNGRWNIQALTGIRSGDQRRGQTINLPDVSAEKVRILITDRQGRQTEIGPIRFTASNERLQWVFQGSLPPSAALKGRLGLRKPFNHEIQISIDSLDAVSSDLLAEHFNFQAEANWNGYVDAADRVRGQLSVNRAVVGPLEAAGKVRFEVGSERLRAEVGQMAIGHADIEWADILLAGGDLTYRPANEQVVLRNLTAEIGPVMVNGGAQWDTQSGEIISQGRWLGVSPDEITRHQGRWRADITGVEAGFKNAEVRVEADRQSQGQLLEAAATITGGGTEWTKSLWTITFDTLRRQNSFADLNWGPGKINITVDWPVIRLERAELNNVKRLQASGAYAADRQEWDFVLDAQGIRTSAREQAPRTGVFMRSQGNLEEAVISEARIRRGDFEANAEASITLPAGHVKQGTLNAAGHLPQYADDEVMSRFSRRPWQLQSTLAGTVTPLNVKMDGHLQVEIPETQALETNVLAVPFELRAEGSDLTLETASYVSDQASWNFSGYYHLADQTGRLFAELQKMPLSLLSDFFGGWSYQGRLSGKLTADFPQPELSELDMNGSWAVRDFRAESFAAEMVSGDIHMKSGLATLENIFVQQGAGELRGRGSINLNAGRQASFEFKARDWLYPAEPSVIGISADADVNVEIDLVANQVLGRGRLSGDVRVLDRQAGRLQVTAGLDDRILSITQAEGSVLGGDISGEARIPLQNWLDSRANLTIQGIQLDRLPQWQPGLEGVAGLLSGQVVLQDTVQPNPLEPLELILQVQMQDGRFHAAQIGNLRLTAYAGTERLVVTDAVLQLFSGIIQGQARWTRHDRDYIHLRASFNQLDVNQIVQAVHPEAEPVEGRIDGTVNLLTTSRLRGLSGRFTASLSESNLVNNRVVGTLYNTLALGLRSPGPQGRGTIEVYPAGAALNITNFYYFNEGIEIRGSGVIEDIEKGIDSPISGIAFGTTRPLGRINLPGIRELDNLMGVLQLGSAVVRIEGTLGDVQVNVVPLPEVTDAIRNLLWSQRENGP
jgi:hypothetical protein